jgi:hypothetical protein
MPAIDSAPVPAQGSDPVIVDTLQVDTLRNDPVSAAPASLTCPYCASSMDPRSFRAWASEARLITGECEGCGRSVTLPSRWLTTPPVMRQR